MARKYKKKRTFKKRTSTYRKRKSKRTYTKRRAKAKVGNYAHVKLIRNIDRKQRSITQKYVYFGKSRVYNRNADSGITPGVPIPEGNVIIPGNQQCQWITFNANSPYIFCDHAHSQPANSAWEFDDTRYQVPGYNDGNAHPLQPDVPGGLNPTLLPGMFEDVRRALYQYKRHTCIGYKITVTVTPMQGSMTHHNWQMTPAAGGAAVDMDRREASQEGIVFLMKHTKNTGANPSQLSATTTAHDLYRRNFTKCAKFKCGSTSNDIGHPLRQNDQTGLGSIVSNSGSNQSCSLSMSYSPKAFQGIKDVMDNGDLKNQTTLDPSFVAQDPAVGTLLHQASNTDCITLGVVPWFQARPAGVGDITRDASIPRNCGNLLIQYKVEATYVHSDPNRLGNALAPTMPSAGGAAS